jgi:hypothetical protein
LSLRFTLPFPSEIMSPRLVSPLLRFLPIAFFLAGTLGVRGQNNVPDYELPAVAYSKTPPNDAITHLQKRIAAGEVTLPGTDRELLLNVLKALNVPVESQTLVFSKTSLQKERISPATPRALYFSETVYVGWVPGGLIEVAAIDPQLGPVFYSVKANETDAPKTFSREANCMLCHGYFFIRDIPSILTMTMFPDKTGEILPRTDFDVVSDSTRFEKRWGGWYVTGYTGKANHRGNAFGSGEGKAMVFVPSEKRPTELSEFFDTSRYPAGTSDMLTLLLLEHQTEVQNAITRLSQNTRLSKFTSETELVDRLLFRKSAELPAGITRNESYLKIFLADAKRSRAGDSLKDLQVDSRIFRNRCSYLIYSAAFAAIPESAKTKVYAALYAALHDETPNRYAYLERDEKKRIYDILVETHPEARRHFEKLALRRG